MSRYTYAISALLTLGGAVTAIAGIWLGEMKPFFAGMVLICGATVFALLYLGTRRKAAVQAYASGTPAGD